MDTHCKPTSGTVTQHSVFLGETKFKGQWITQGRDPKKAEVQGKAKRSADSHAKVWQPQTVFILPNDRNPQRVQNKPPKAVSGTRL